jgi:hypothetical protein
MRSFIADGTRDLLFASFQSVAIPDTESESRIPNPGF